MAGTPGPPPDGVIAPPNGCPAGIQDLLARLSCAQARGLPRTSPSTPSFGGGVWVAADYTQGSGGYQAFDQVFLHDDQAPYRYNYASLGAQEEYFMQRFIDSYPDGRPSIGMVVTGARGALGGAGAVFADEATLQGLFRRFQQSKDLRPDVVVLASSCCAPQESEGEVSIDSLINSLLLPYGVSPRTFAVLFEAAADSPPSPAAGVVTLYSPTGAKVSVSSADDFQGVAVDYAQRFVDTLVLGPVGALPSEASDPLWTKWVALGSVARPAIRRAMQTTLGMAPTVLARFVLNKANVPQLQTADGQKAFAARLATLTKRYDIDGAVLDLRAYTDITEPQDMTVLLKVVEGLVVAVAAVAPATFQLNFLVPPQMMTCSQTKPASGDGNLATIPSRCTPDSVKCKDLFAGATSPTRSKAPLTQRRGSRAAELRSTLAVTEGAADDDDHGRKLSTGTIVGIVLGSLAGVVLLAVVVTLLSRGSRRSTSLRAGLGMRYDARGPAGAPMQFSSYRTR